MKSNGGKSSWGSYTRLTFFKSIATLLYTIAKTVVSSQYRYFASIVKEPSELGCGRESNGTKPMGKA